MKLQLLEKETPKCPKCKKHMKPMDLNYMGFQCETCWRLYQADISNL